MVLDLPWDKPIRGELLDQARAVLRELVLAQDIKFPCCVLPIDKDDWILLGYWDGGKPASSCCLYVRTKLDYPGPDPPAVTAGWESLCHSLICCGGSSEDVYTEDRDERAATAGLIDKDSAPQVPTGSY